MEGQARKSRDVTVRRPVSPTGDQRSTTSQSLNNSRDPDSEIDHLKKAWESTAKALAIVSEQFKRRAIVPLLRWALSALGEAPALPTDLPIFVINLRSEVMKLERNLAEEKGEHEKTRSRCLQQESNVNEANNKRRRIELQCKELETRLVEEEVKYESIRKRCLQLQKSLDDDNEKREKMKLALLEDERLRQRCIQLEKSLHAEEENTGKLKLRCRELEVTAARMNQAIVNAGLILELSKDEKLLIEKEALRAQGIV